MTRFTLLHLLLVSTPFLVFLGYRALIARRRRAAGQDIDETPFQILLLSGALLGVIGLAAAVFLVSRDAPDTGMVYVPPEIIDGEVRPGRFVPRDELEAAEAAPGEAAPGDGAGEAAADDGR